MAEIGGCGTIPDGEDVDHAPGNIAQQMHIEGGVVVGSVQSVVGNNESGGEVIEIGSLRTPPVDVGTGKHVELGNPKGAIVVDFERSSELVLNHFELRLRIDDGAEASAIGSGIRISERQQRQV